MKNPASSPVANLPHEKFSLPEWPVNWEKKVSALPNFELLFCEGILKGGK